ncbi:sensor histidine kinase [Pusillimonas sp.]|uniref:sensor histidine kinase n=1 Tax=Pusillimonas sp. TaxID=3040095 RepID=UPI0029B3BEC3|nr:sensor histidine kinase [Pusillimonas sp.]MDX3893203.1 sensor histidine kinase [Pusillimonas sp.]
MKEFEEAHIPCSILSDVIQCAPEPIVVADPSQVVVVFNRAAQKVFLRGASETLGTRLSLLLLPPAGGAHAGLDHLFPRHSGSDDPAGTRGTFRGVRATGDEFSVHASVHRLAAPSGSYFAIFLRDPTGLASTNPALSAPCEALAPLCNALLRAQDRDIARIAQELHDELGQTLTALNMELSQLEADCAQDRPGPAERVPAMRGLLKTSLASIRRIASDMRPAMLDDLGLFPALEWLASDFASRYGIDARLCIQKDIPQPCGETATALYRIVQEALTNVARHARATIVEVGLHRRTPDIVLSVRDNGVGVTPERLARASLESLGVRGIKERARQLNGSVTIQASEGFGFRLEVRLPFDPSDSG